MKRILCSFTLVFVVGMASQTEAQTVPDKKLPKSGTLSSTFVTGSSVNVAPEPFGLDNPTGNDQSPITGSVSRMRPGVWQVKVFNNSQKDTYSVNVEVVQLNESFTAVKRDFFSYTIAPQGFKSQDVSEGLNVKGAQLNLSKWKNLTAKKKASARSSQSNSQASSEASSQSSSKK